MDQTYLRGDLYYADLGRGLGSEQQGNRPVVIIQNDVGNRHSPTVIVAAISSKVGVKATTTWRPGAALSSHLSCCWNKLEPLTSGGFLITLASWMSDISTGSTTP